MFGNAQCEGLITMRVIAASLLGITGAGQIDLVAEKFPEK